MQLLEQATAVSTHMLNDAELRTTAELHRFKTELLNILAEQFGGETTLNHLRVGSFIGLRSQHGNTPTSNSEIAAALKLSRATVTRIVNHFIEAGWVTELPHPDDGRKRLLSITRGHPDGDRAERAFRKQLNALVDRYVAGELIKVSPDKKSYNEIV